MYAQLSVLASWENIKAHHTVSRLFRHASIQITMDIYGHVIPDFAEQELEKMKEMHK